MKARIELDGHGFDVVASMENPAFIEVDGERFHLLDNGVGVQLGGAPLHVELDARSGRVRVDGVWHNYRILEASRVGAAAEGKAQPSRIRPPMNGKLERMAVKVGQQVTKGEVLFVLEAMKMQNEVRSPVAGRVVAVHGSPGAPVEPSMVLVELE